MDAQDAQDYLARVSTVLSSTIASVPTNTDSPNLAPRLLDHFRHPTDHRADLLPVAQPLVLFILCILCIHVQLVENRFSTTWPLFPIGHEDSLFHPRMIRPAGGARHPGARASRPHALPSPAAQFPPMLQPATLPAGTAWALPKQSQGAVANRPIQRRWPRLCQGLCGRDARAPRRPSPHKIVMPTGQKPRNILAPLVVEGSPSVFVFIRVQEKVTPGAVPGSASRPTGA